MFTRLRVKFTMSILLILIIFLSVLSSGLYIGTKTLIDSSSKNILRKSAEDIIYTNNIGYDYFGMPVIPGRKDLLEDIKDRFSFSEYKLKLSYAIYDQSLNLIYVKNNGEITFSNFEEYVSEAYRDKDKSFVVDKINGVEYRIYTVFFSNLNKVGVIQLYQDISMEIFVLNHLRNLLLVLSLGSVFVLTLISWYLAGKSIKPVKESWEKQKEFVADASHELRTPITVIQTNLDAALSDKEGTIEENEMWLNNAYSETQVMTKLVEELLMLAKIDANQIILNMEKIDLSSICSNTVDKFFIKMKEKEIYLETDINQNVFIRGDSFRIIQLITIFIDNAIKYTPSGGRIFISLKREKSIARLIIEDNGIGIGEFDKERIFDRFYRADKARHREEGGTGLGLSIAKWIVDNHKGSILVKNGREKGTKFVIEIPINI